MGLSEQFAEVVEHNALTSNPHVLALFSVSLLLGTQDKQFNGIEAT